MRWLASLEAEFIQGQIIFVNGGASLSARAYFFSRAALIMARISRIGIACPLIAGQKRSINCSNETRTSRNGSSKVAGFGTD
jgi:hypothetical protein